MLTWQVAGPRARVCGFCGPTRVIAVGERYLAATQAGAVRCVDCATTRWGLEPPVELTRADEGGEAAAPGTQPTLDWVPAFDWKARAAGDA